MIRIARIALTVSALSLGLGLAGCESFDPTSVFDSDFFSTKKKLQGERHPVFPEGTPGVQQGVPPELVKGYQPAEQAEPSAQQAQSAEPKPEAKQTPWPDPPRQPTAGGWSGSAQPSGQVAWPEPPTPR